MITIIRNSASSINYSLLKVFFLSICIESIVFATPAASQNLFTVSGTVRDKSTGESIIGATVKLEEAKKGAVSNKYGFYSLKAPSGTYMLTISYVGYRPFKTSITIENDDVSYNPELEPSVTQSADVVVTAERAEDNVRSVAMGTAQINMATLKQLPVVLGETDVLKSIQLLPGISSASEGSTGFNVRGGGADQNLILLDEAVIYNPSHVLGFFSVFNSDAIKDFKLYKAAIPARYGGRLSSVLDVRQRDGNVKEFGVHGGIGLISSKLLVEGPIVPEKGSFMVAGRRSYADIFLPLASDESVRDNVAFFYDLNVKANYELGESDKLYLSGYFGRDVFEVARTIGNSYGNATFNLRWSHIFNGALFANVSAIYSDYDYEFKIFSPGSEFQLNSNIISANGKIDFFWNASESHKVEFGAEAINYTFNPGEVAPMNGSSIIERALDRKYALEYAAYLADEWEISPVLSISAGLRLNGFLRQGNDNIRTYTDNKPIVYDSVTGQYRNGTPTDTTFYSSGETISSFIGLEPRISARLLLAEQTSLKVAYNRTRQNIHLISNTAAPTPLDLWQPSGPYLDPQVADQYSIGLFQSLDDETYSLSLEGYWKTFNNLVDFVDGAELLGNNYLETEIVRGKGRAYGLEFFLEKTKGDFTGWISYTLARSERKIEPFAGGPGVNKGEWYPSVYDKTHVLNVVGTYRLNENWTFSANFIYNTGIPATFPVGKYVIGGLVIPQFDGTRNAQRLPDYHRMDVSARWESSKKEGFRTAWVFAVYNLYNRLNTASIAFRQNQDEFRSESVRLSLFGIVPSVTWEFKF